MVSSWRSLTLGDVCYITDGAHSKVERVDEGVMYLTSKNIGEGNLKLDKFDYITEESHSKLFTDTKKSQRRLRVGDVLMGIIGTFGNCYIYKASDHFGISSSVAILRPNQELVLPEFLYYVVSSNSFKAIVNKFKGGSVQGYTNITTIKALPILVPPVEEQRRIIAQLSPCDDKIKLNKSLNQTLEQMAQALFKSWFVDFDPVIDNALAACNDIPEALQHKAEQRLQAQQLPDFKPLPDDIRALFPSEFEQTDEPTIGIYGWIPKGWKKDNLKSFGKVVTGKTPPKKVENAFDTAGIPFITPTDVDSDVYALNVARRLTQEGVKVVKNNVIEKGSVCVTCIGSQMGKTVITPTKAVTNQQLNSIILSDEFSRNYIFMNLRTRREELFNLGSSGSTMPILNKSSFETLSVIRPSDDILKSFSKFTENQIEKILVNSKQNNQLEEIRDSLLPKLISGEITLSNKDVA